MEFLTVDDCKEIAYEVLNDKEVEIIDYKFCKLESDVEGIMSLQGKLNIRVRTHLKEVDLACFMKCFRKNHSFHSEYLLDTAVFVKEPLFFIKIGKDLKKFSVEKVMPDCYLARVNDLVVLEDLSDYKIKDHGELFNLEEMKAAVRALAVFHASSLIFESKYSIKLDSVCESFFFDTLYLRKEGHMGMMHLHTGIKALRAVVDKHLPGITGDVKKTLFEVYESLPERVLPSVKYRNVVTHGDLWGNNIMFRRNGGVTAKLVDFQLVKYNPPSVDLVMMIHLNSDEELRRRHRADLVRLYYETLAASVESFGLDPAIELPAQEFHAGFQETLPGALAITSLFIHFTSLPQQTLATFVPFSEPFRKFITQDRTSIIMTSFETCPTYKQKLTTALNDLVNAII